eukprot:TRINITY_DN6629_c0_g1_i2.p2 TRINITY_DN6629_c0_g1~~TRINITY_DN6629_c0_g1_i2.p2  ORF type:complete len:116 (+),score=9.92 TRINITY_DN6629_c0_g1_i2:417-764(+)
MEVFDYKAHFESLMELQRVEAEIFDEETVKRHQTLGRGDYVFVQVVEIQKWQTSFDSHLRKHQQLFPSYKLISRIFGNESQKSANISIFMVNLKNDVASGWNDSFHFRVWIVFKG